MKVKFEFRHIRRKDWSLGRLYPFPTIAITWKNGTLQWAICFSFIWLSMRFDIWFIHRDEDLVGLMKQVFDINSHGLIIHPDGTHSPISSDSSRR